MIGIDSVHDWMTTPGALVSWTPSQATLEKARNAPVNPVPPSHQQAQHLRAYHDLTSRDFEFSRLVIPAFDIAGRCDIRTMSHVLNSHVRRHDTYHSWFEFKDPKDIVRHTIENSTDIKLVPVKHGEQSAAQVCQHILDTPNPLEWDCFRFGIVQRDDHFTFFASVDHLHMDPVIVNVVFVEIVMMYTALVGGGAPIPLPEVGRYADYCVRQSEFRSTLSVESPQVQGWVDFAEENGGSLPHFPLPLGVSTEPCGGALMTIELLDEHQTDRFEDICVSAGVRFSGGVWACAALANHEITGADVFRTVTPTDTRSTPAEMVTTGWYTGLIPISIPVESRSFEAAARAAQACFDGGSDLAVVPFDWVLDFAPWLRAAGPGSTMMSFLDSGAAPLSPVIIAQLKAMNAGIFSDGRYASQLNMWVNRLGKETTVTVAYPDNPVARESIESYLSVLKSVYQQVASGAAVVAASTAEFVAV